MPTNKKENVKNFSDKFMNEIMNISYADFSKKFADQEKMFWYIYDSVSKIADSSEYGTDMKTLNANHPDFINKNMKSKIMKQHYSILNRKEQKIGYDNAIIYHNFLNKVRKYSIEEKPDNYEIGDIVKKKNSGELAFKILRKEYQEVKSREHFIDTYALGNSEEYCRTNFDIKARDDIDKMIKYLENADSMFRGSSDEYKDIKNELKNLKSQISDFSYSNHRTLAISYSAIVEKMDNYINKRKHILDTYPINSYKGKRVFAMEKLKASLEGIIDCMAYNQHVIERKEGKPLYSDADCIQSNMDIIANFKKQTFSPERYDKVISFKMAKEGKSFYLDGNIKKTMNDLLAGSYVSFKGADNLRKMLEVMEKGIEKHDNARLDKSLNLLKSTKNEINLHFIDNAIWEQTTDKNKITGNTRLDEKITDYMINRIEAARNVKNVENEIHAENAGMIIG